MFKILGSDGIEYGPVSAEILREWIAGRRANAATRVRIEGGGEWKPLSEFPEFADALAANARPPAPPPLIGPPVLNPATGPGGTAKTSGMAVASLVLGFLGLCGITAIVGLILGIMAQVKISRSGGRLKGRGIAIAGICLSGFMLLVSIPFIAALTLPALAKAKRSAESVSCVNNVKQVCLAIRLYADDNDGKCPQAADWCDAVTANLAGPEVFRCPQRRGERSGYAFNTKLAGRTLSSIPPDVVLVFEASGGWNFTGDAKDIVSRPPHGRSYVFGFADGSVRQVGAEELPDLRWEP